MCTSCFFYLLLVRHGFWRTDKGWEGCTPPVPFLTLFSWGGVPLLKWISEQRTVPSQQLTWFGARTSVERPLSSWAGLVVLGLISMALRGAKFADCQEFAPEDYAVLASNLEPTMAKRLTHQDEAMPSPTSSEKKKQRLAVIIQGWSLFLSVVFENHGKLGNASGEVLFCQKELLLHFASS